MSEFCQNVLRISISLLMLLFAFTWIMLLYILLFMFPDIHRGYYEREDFDSNRVIKCSKCDGG